MEPTNTLTQNLWRAGWHDLDALASRLCVKPPKHHQRHDARADVLILASCFQLMLQKLVRGIGPYVTHKVTLPKTPSPIHC